MLDVPAFIHFRRAGRQLVGSYHLWCIERDAGRGFRYGGRNGIRRVDVGGFDA